LVKRLAAAFPTPFADTYPGSPEVDALHYVFRLSLSDETDEIRGEAIADLQFTRVGLAQIASISRRRLCGKGIGGLGALWGRASALQARIRYLPVWSAYSCDAGVIVQEAAKALPASNRRFGSGYQHLTERGER